MLDWKEVQGPKIPVYLLAVSLGAGGYLLDPFDVLYYGDIKCIVSLRGVVKKANKNYYIAPSPD